MNRSGGGMAARALRAALALQVLAICVAGPIGPLLNVTSSDLGLKEGSCALGDVVYMPGDEFPGAGPCERCTCSAGGVSCEKQRCEPRPGCKALHRPDHCCPTYQCECEQEGRVYGNGEKLVDPQDPCRVCYCQGGEVVCRRIACFVRDDCRPRLVPGRCCPEYDNCPLRGVTAIPGVAPSISTEIAETSPAPPAPKENVKQEITIKEITPVSEIPVITEVKIKEILPSPSIDVAEYSSSKSPLIVREATSEKDLTGITELFPKTEAPVVIEEQPVASSDDNSQSTPDLPTKSTEENTEMKATNDSPPSKISLSTQDSINSEIYSSILTSVPTMGSPSNTPLAPVIVSTKAPLIEEEDPTLFDHNPAFPPLPDDLSVLRNHEDEILPESNAESDHVSIAQDVTEQSVSSSTEPATTQEPLTTTPKETIATMPPTTARAAENSAGIATAKDLSTPRLETAVSTDATNLKESPMLNLRSAIPTEILNVPSFVPEEITGESDEVTEVTTAAAELTPLLSSTQASPSTEDERIEEQPTEKAEPPSEVKIDSTAQYTTIKVETTTARATEATSSLSSSQNSEEQTTSSISKSNMATEITAQTELSSLPIETSDQNPHDTAETIEKDKITDSDADAITEPPTSKESSPIGSEVITLSREIPSSTDNQSFENVETTEFVLTSFGSSESATDAVELIKISGNLEKHAAIIESTPKKNSVLTDLINLVGDVAAIGDHTESIEGHFSTSAPSISDSEELIPVNSGYKSKNSNWNVNSITEVPAKSKNQGPASKQKGVEIEDEEADGLTDPPPPHDKVEPTTRRPLIDNVSDDMLDNRTDTKDIEIITKSYVPTINRRPTKVIMKKSSERLAADESVPSTEAVPVSASAELATESSVGVSAETATVHEPAELLVENAELLAESAEQPADLPAETPAEADTAQ